MNWLFVPEAEILPSRPYAGKLERASVAAFVPTAALPDAKARTVALAGTLYHWLQCPPSRTER